MTVFRKECPVGLHQPFSTKLRPHWSKKHQIPSDMTSLNLGPKAESSSKARNLQWHRPTLTPRGSFRRVDDSTLPRQTRRQQELWSCYGPHAGNHGRLLHRGTMPPCNFVSLQPKRLRESAGYRSGKNSCSIQKTTVHSFRLSWRFATT